MCQPGGAHCRLEHPLTTAMTRSSMDPSDNEQLSFETRCVHIGVNKDSSYNSVITPIYPSSTFYWDDLDTTKGYDYTRS
jgi:hypothetical protein